MSTHPWIQPGSTQGFSLLKGRVFFFHAVVLVFVLGGNKWLYKSMFMTCSTCKLPWDNSVRIWRDISSLLTMGYSPLHSPPKPNNITPATVAGSCDDCVKRRGHLLPKRGWCSIMNLFKVLFSLFTQEQRFSDATEKQKYWLNCL